MDNDRQLRKYFDFDEKDLFANRNGTLTSRQQTRLVEAEKLWNKISLVGGLIVLIIAILPSILIGFEVAPCLPDLCSEWPLALRLFMASMVLIWMPIWGYYGVRVIRNALSTHKLPSLKKAEGPINIIKVESYNNTTHTQTEDYELHIGGKEFDCDSELADIMIQGDIYAIYYIKDTKEIMSAEMLAKGK